MARRRKGKKERGGRRQGEARGASRLSEERLSRTGGILAELNQSPARSLLGATTAEDMAAPDEAVLAAPAEAEEKAAAEATAPGASAGPAEGADAAPAEPGAGPAEGPAPSAGEGGPGPAPERAHGEALEALLEEVAARGIEPKAPLPEGEDAPLEDLPVYVDRAPRVPLETYVKVVKGERIARALASDISESGIFLAAMALPTVRVGERVHLELALPGEQEPIWAQGEVVRDGTRIGFHSLAIRFTYLSEVDRAQIRDYVRARAHLVE